MKKVNLLKTLFCFIIILPFNAGAEPVSSGGSNGAFSVVERDRVQDLIKEYEIQLEAIDNDILNFKMEREWLYRKISGILDQNRLLPEVLKESRTTITQKIMVALKRKKRLMELIQTHKRDIEKLNTTIDPGGGSGLVSPAETTGEMPRDMALTPSGFNKELKNSLVRAGLEHQLDIAVDDPGLTLENRVPILFDSCQFTLTPEHKRYLGQLARFLKPYQVRVDVAGFTDYLKIRGRQMTNIELSAKRAGAVVRELKKNGMKSSVFKITGMGRYEKCLEKSERCRALSRRVDIAIHLIKQ